MPSKKKRTPPGEKAGPKAGRQAADRFRAVNWINIINQLAVTRANRLLDDGDLPFPQFVMLSHLAREPRRRYTVTEVADAFQQPQPGTTKTLQKLQEKGFVEQGAHPTDGRAKQFAITKQGAKVFEHAKQQMGPMLEWLFDDWSADDVAHLIGLLDRLKIKLDENR